jgi:hypothetical protein
VKRQVNRTDGLAIAAIVLPVIAAFIALSAPRAVPFSHDLPAPRVALAAAAAAEEADLRRVERLRDAAVLRDVDGAFGLWNQAEVDGASPHDPGRALGTFQLAYLRLAREDRLTFLAERSQRFLALVHRIRAVLEDEREDPDAVRALRMLVGGNFERRALQSGLLDADDVVLAAGFKLRIVLAVAPTDVALVSRVERLAFHGFIAARARGQSVERRLRSVEELGRLDPHYPVHLASAQLHALAGRWDAAATELDLHPDPTVRTRNNRLWLARKQHIAEAP